MKKTRTEWSIAQLAILQDCYANLSNRELAKIIGVTEPAIGAKAHKLGLKKSESFMLERSKLGWFKQGHETHNKGKKMPADIYERCKGTMFKKGRLPHHTRNDGDIRIQRDKSGQYYAMVRLSLAKWKLRSHIEWEKYNPPVSKGMCLWHIDGDTLNDSIGNLELITRRENRIRNSGSTTLSDKWVAFTIYSKKYPELKETINAMPELIELKRNQIKLKRQCHSSQN